MTHVFLSYKREDETRALRLVQALEHEGLTVWWDRALPGAESWHEGIGRALDAAGCVVVLWSKGSVGQEGHFVRDEAGRALKRGRLVPVLLDRVDPPLGFGELQAIDLTRWRGGARDPFFRDVVSSVRAKLEGRSVPAATGPRARVARRLVAGSGASLALVLLSAFGANALRIQDRLCAASALTDACGAMGLGDRPAHAERVAWEERPAGSCPALREHLRRFPEGAYREQAVALLQAARAETSAVATPFSRAVELYERTSERPFPTREAAEGDARRRWMSEASGSALYCAARDSLERFLSVSESQGEPDCRQDPRGGWSCSLTARGTCNLERRAVGERCERRADRP
ncbi:MAG: toll/interleukin-1 receptor domain-containing protein [Gemmatimonadetes bacterium]|nr:toll/interleukin-1 receptor domain-containing protein [Gemmatimonadota bacterium]